MSDSVSVPPQLRDAIKRTVEDGWSIPPDRRYDAVADAVCAVTEAFDRLELRAEILRLQADHARAANRWEADRREGKAQNERLIETVRGLYAEIHKLRASRWKENEMEHELTKDCPCEPEVEEVVAEYVEHFFVKLHDYPGPRYLSHDHRGTRKPEPFGDYAAAESSARREGANAFSIEKRFVRRG